MRGYDFLHAVFGVRDSEGGVPPDGRVREAAGVVAHAAQRNDETSQTMPLVELRELLFVSARSAQAYCSRLSPAALPLALTLSNLSLTSTSWHWRPLAQDASAVACPHDAPRTESVTASANHQNHHQWLQREPRRNRERAPVTISAGEQVQQPRGRVLPRQLPPGRNWPLWCCIMKTALAFGGQWEQARLAEKPVA